MPFFNQRLLTSTALSSIVALTLGTSYAATSTGLPTGGKFVAGNGSVTTSGTTQTITQTTSNAVVEHTQYNVGSGYSVLYNTPGASSLTVDRVTGVNPSVIAGNIRSNGELILVNPNGVLFTQGAQINTQSLIATTSNISNANAMAGALNFETPSKSGTASVVNRGTITVAQGGLVALVAPGVENSGTINAQLGRVSLSSGNIWTLDLYGDRLVKFSASDIVSQTVKTADGKALMGAVNNTGSIKVGAGQVQLTVSQAKQIVDHSINMTGIIQAVSASQKGGAVLFDAGKTGLVSIAGTIDVSGVSGGSITIKGGTVLQQGILQADGTTDSGGKITVSASDYTDTENSSISASGANGGSIVIGGSDSVYSSGHLNATGRNGEGGEVSVTAPTMNLIGTNINVSGTTDGGNVNIGGGPHGATSLAHAKTVHVSDAAVINASSGQNGNGGRINIWSDDVTTFNGAAIAKGGSQGGNGGIIDISSAQNGGLSNGAVTDVSAAHGKTGTIIFDPKNVITSSAPSFDLANPNPTSATAFNHNSVTLSDGNVVVTDDLAKIGGVANAGALYLFDGKTGQLISEAYGTHKNDYVGNGSITALTNGNFVAVDKTWDGKHGAATFGNGTTGLMGAISADNSLVGNGANSFLGTKGVTALANGNYVVDNPYANGRAGAVTFGNGTTGVTGMISSVNSLVGSHHNDFIGVNGITALTNGNYVVNSNLAFNDRGVVTFGNGMTGTTGFVTSSNSLMGRTGDRVGYGGVTALTSGNYVVRNLLADHSSGAVTFGNGATGVTGKISSSNSLIGKAGDRIGAGGVIALSTGNYVINNMFANHDAGAVTFGNGTTGVTGTINSSNSLIGSKPRDYVGLNKVIALSSGNYVIDSSAALHTKGAVTFGDGKTGTVGTIDSSNSLVGSKYADRIGYQGVTSLTNGNYVIDSPLWNDRRGAVTFGNGKTGIVGTVTSANSLVGTDTFDYLGVGGVTKLTTGNYVVDSFTWGSGRGAVTFGNGTTGTTGTINASNSLVGDTFATSKTLFDTVGYDSNRNAVTALANGNYVVVSDFWHNARGAVTMGNGTTGISGTINSSNSLVGTRADYFNNIYVDDGYSVIAGFKGFGPQGYNGAYAMDGYRLTGDNLGSNGIKVLADGDYQVTSKSWNSGRGAVTTASSVTGLTGTVNSTNSVLGTKGVAIPYISTYGSF